MSKYSLKRKVVHISIENEDGQGTAEYELREMSAAKRDLYLDRLVKRLRLIDGKPAGVSRFEGLQADLVSNCLFKEDQPVTEKDIQQWPSSMVADIFKQAQDLNQLGKEIEEAQGKNE